MKRFIFFIFFIFLSGIGTVDSQTIIINNDSILAHYKQDNAYNVFYYYYYKSIRDKLNVNFSPKEAYYSKELKFYLLKLLDENEYLEYRLYKYKNAQEDLLNRESVNYNEKFSKLILKNYTNEENLSFDSIWIHPTLYNRYLYFVLDRLVEKKKKEYVEHRNFMPPYEVLVFHGQIAYPEYYVKLKNWILSSNCPILDGRNINQIYICLLYLNDPEAKNKFDGVISKYIASKGRYANSSQILNILSFMKSPYAIQKLIELSNTNFEVTLMSSDDPEDLGINALSILADLWDSTFLNDEDYILNVEKKLNPDYLIKNKDKIIKEASDLIRRYEEDQKYWMINMPFYKE